MSTEASLDSKFQIGHVLFMDIVGYSKLLVNDQARSVRQLNEVVQNSEPFRVASKKNKLLRLATGDGMALVFRDSPESPVRCALEISRGLRKQIPAVPVRMGIHSGLVHGVTDVNNRLNVAGAGINIAQRVMDCGDADHILLSKHVAEDLEHHARWQPLLHDLGQCEVKHGVRIGLVNIFDSEAGNPRLPETIRRLRKKRTATNLCLFSTTAAVSLLVVGGSWLVSARYVNRHFSDQTASVRAPEVTLPVPRATGSPFRSFNLGYTDSHVAWPPTPPARPASSQGDKLFAGRWRGTVHNSGPKGRSDSPIEFTIDQSEAQWSHLNGGTTTHQGRTLSYRRSYRLGTRTNVYVHADLILNDDGRTATYKTGQVSVTGKVRSKTSGTGTVEKVY